MEDCCQVALATVRFRSTEDKSRQLRRCSSMSFVSQTPMENCWKMSARVLYLRRSVQLKSRNLRKPIITFHSRAEAFLHCNSIKSFNLSCVTFDDAILTLPSSLSIISPFFQEECGSIITKWIRSYQAAPSSLPWKAENSSYSCCEVHFCFAFFAP